MDGDLSKTFPFGKDGQCGSLENDRMDLDFFNHEKFTRVTNLNVSLCSKCPGGYFCFDLSSIKKP
jgi:hypothetical protein